MNIRLRYVVLFSILSLIFSCAQQVAPSGGIKDENPPKVLSSKPLNKTINFKAEKITIKFDEYVQIKDPSKIVISPLLKDKPTIEANGKLIEITFNKTLPEPNTTYTINFGNSIVDNNEGNPLENFSYVFATGDFLDSNYVKGQIKNAFNAKPEKDILVGLYKSNQFTDTTVFKFYANYFSKSKEDGSFIIENLPNDSFLLFAFKDQNSDNKYQKTELVAFENKPLKTEEIKPKKLLLFEPNNYKPNTIIDTLSKNIGKYQFVFYKNENCEIRPSSNKEHYSNWTKGPKNLDTLTLYFKQINDSSSEEFIYTNTDTSFKINIKTKNKARYQNFSLNIIGQSIPTDSIQIVSSVPIDTLTINNIDFKEDTIKLNPLYFKQINNQKWLLYHPLKEGKNYTIAIEDSSIQNIYNQYNKSINTLITPKNTKEFGTLNIIGNYNGKEQLIVQLVENNADEKVIKEYTIVKNTTIKLNYILPGQYLLKVIQDVNYNSRWDNGNYEKQIQPELVVYKNEPIIIKANWDIDQTIDFDKLINNL
ncbi:MAG: Ig-like domain-containing protein [Bacteroidia bacterium]|nr:Ig-like domain-containing protein [Bacteroidia bacterium]MCF8426346.1 Ig-like domain-containing protein [Bacteroidia bacterium]MCF8445755.1 Ig-like domain-containing protein [Bacteroidia bacterium]